MPIRFRCVYCNQLLGISRRKAGTIVRCTSCEGQLIVPDPSDGATEAGSQEQAGDGPGDQPQKTEDSGGRVGVFDAEEFDAFLEPLNPGGGGSAVASPPAPSAKRPSAAPVRTFVEPIPVVAGRFTRRDLTIMIVSAVLGFGLSFAAGLWVGMSLR
jgi:hypothetical protein